MGLCLAASAFCAPALADGHGYRAGCFEDEPGPAREWTVNVAVGFEPDPGGGRRVVRRPVEMRFPAICGDAFPPLDRTGLTFAVDIGGRCLSRLESSSRKPFKSGIATFFLDVDSEHFGFRKHALFFNPYKMSPDRDGLRFDVGPENAIGLHPLRYSIEDGGAREAQEDAWFILDALGEPVGHVSCTRVGAAPNPVCDQSERFGGVLVSALYNRTSLPRWREIGAQMRRYFECAVKDRFPGVR